MIKFGYMINYVGDVKKCLTFFQKAFGLEERFLDETGDYGELDTGSTVLAFASHELANSNLPCGYTGASASDKPLGTEIGLVTDNVEGAHKAALKNGAEEIRAPEQKPWGQLVSYVKCPSGLLIELCTPMG